MNDHEGVVSKSCGLQSKTSLILLNNGFHVFESKKVVLHKKKADP